ncbi:hypothetical protein SAMN05216302_10317 [Nitrosomonas aestuarii]|uniref:Uncharacterized protein n=1 Tax=Nitrosomonas aestuarii TaxID=52441 RepID=A0A1I4EZ22_9PROT|nr:hypothetical protein SAMN05216302_10317 [Nitrosomonas aestuarii]
MFLKLNTATHKSIKSKISDTNRKIFLLNPKKLISKVLQIPVVNILAAMQNFHKYSVSQGLIQPWLTTPSKPQPVDLK